MDIQNGRNKNSLNEIWFSKEAMRVRQAAAKCRKHCLQDCVYFPSDVPGEAGELLRELERATDKARGEVKAKLLKQVEYYTAILSRKANPAYRNFSRWLNIRKEIVKLLLIKKDLL